MRQSALIRLAALVVAAAAPAAALAGGDGPASRSTSASKSAPAHKHSPIGRVKGQVCERCAANKVGAGQIPPKPDTMFDGAQIVGCSHSSNGVCAPCMRLLEMPGQVTMVAPGTPGDAAPAMPAMAAASAPGRATATDAAPGRAVVASADPEPIGVMQTNFLPNNPAPAAAPAATAPAPAPASTPFLPETREARPRVLGHLFGVAPMGKDIRDARGAKGRRMREAHAATAYGPEAGKVEELPASMVYGRGPR